MKKWLASNFYKESGERQYKNVEQLIICEEFLENPGEKQLLDYKVFCFSGKPEIIQVVNDRNNHNVTDSYYDTNWQRLPLSQKLTKKGTDIIKPKKLEKLISYATILSKEFNFVRVDFYIVNERIYFGEFTFTPANGMIEFQPKEWDLKLAEKIKIN